MKAVIVRILERRERWRDDPRAALERFPDSGNVLAVIRFVAQNPHPNVPARFEDNADALTLLQRYRAAMTAAMNDAEYRLLAAAKKTRMSWTEVGHPMGYLTSPAKAAEQQHRRMVAWRDARGEEVIPIYGKDVDDEAEPVLVWVRERTQEFVNAGKQLLEMRKALESDEGIGAWLEYLDDALTAIGRGEPVGTGLATLLRTLVEDIDEAVSEDDRKLSATLSGDQQEALKKVRALVREYQAYARRARESA